MSKEWKGNRKSVSSMLGVISHPGERASGDYYTTDPEAVLQFVNHIHQQRLLAGGFFNTIWEPACGCGNISKVLIDSGYKVLSTDLYDRGYGVSGVDFLQTTSVPNNCDTIITNPPYCLANEFILHAMEILPPHGRYYALMNISYIAGIERQRDVYANGYLAAIHVYPHRIHCYKNNEVTKHSSPVNYAWFEFSPRQRGVYSLFDPVIKWISK